MPSAADSGPYAQNNQKHPVRRLSPTSAPLSISPKLLFLSAALLYAVLLRRSLLLGLAYECCVEVPTSALCDFNDSLHFLLCAMCFAVPRREMAEIECLPAGHYLVFGNPVKCPGIVMLVKYNSVLPGSQANISLLWFLRVRFCLHICFREELRLLPSMKPSLSFII
ncbi:hypothetical protein BGZ60DRAFT_165000 [Tricladium varicosporioides]|nr:hypothetical protein BGZ60DRAFT_165000 [Hymenoscyphus varicosporioides]